jgi:four helix bundle protein
MEGEKRYDLEGRTFLFARNVRAFVKKLRKTLANVEDIKQLIKASGSVGANYVEVNESVSANDLIFRIKICRKESKESRYWLLLLDTDGNEELEKERQALAQEALELTKIFGAMVYKKLKSQNPKSKT